MALQRKLGRATDQRKAILRGLVSALIQNGKIQTTEARAKEVKNIVEKLITAAIKECDNFSSKKIKVSKAVLDSKGMKILNTVKSKNGRTYRVVEREEKFDMVTVDKPSRLAARKKIINQTYRLKDKDGNKINLANKLFDEIAPRYKGVSGGYTRMYKLGPRRGDAAEMVILELVDKK